VTRRKQTRDKDVTRRVTSWSHVIKRTRKSTPSGWLGFFREISDIMGADEQTELLKTQNA